MKKSPAEYGAFCALLWVVRRTQCCEKKQLQKQADDSQHEDKLLRIENACCSPPASAVSSDDIELVRYEGQCHVAEKLQDHSFEPAAPVALTADIKCQHKRKQKQFLKQLPKQMTLNLLQ